MLIDSDTKGMTVIMYRKTNSRWLKHWDFILLDVIMLQISYICAYVLRNGWNNPYSTTVYLSAAIFLILISICASFFFESYRGILRRDCWLELRAVIQHVFFISVSNIVYLFMIKASSEYSRIFMIYYPVISILLLYTGRLTLKIWLKSHKGSTFEKRAIMIVTIENDYANIVESFRGNPYSEFHVMGIGILDEQETQIKSYQDIPFIMGEENIIEFLRSSWVDEILFSVPRKYIISKQILEKCSLMGITIHIELSNISTELPNQMIEKIEGRTVLSSSMKMSTSRQLFLKRMLDIIGGVVGVMITIILMLIVGPIIYIKSPGPIFFTQIRVGKNGRKFKMYKFRSMYMDAEERKQQLRNENKMSDGMMFKMENDPRIIRGIGNFIRKTSIDEFPQFWNVLKGDMSLVGTRPPTLDEWEQYDLRHRARLAIKPGITGLWQISGRSDITNFEEVVKLDTKYIKEWDLGVDIKIILKTVGVVLRQEGSS
ncbi:MAG: sugar transferase [Lachnospiraceae bacterium]|nr:sugar transferase [Lachnospiraceae bacterium]